MNSRELLKHQLDLTFNLVSRILEDLKDAPLSFPTAKGGNHPLWILGHLTYSEANLVNHWILGKDNPLIRWKEIFGAGSEPVADGEVYPSFDEVWEVCQQTRGETLTLLDSLSEDELDAASKNAPPNREQFFGTARKCFSMIPTHWMMHYGQLADVRRSLGLERIGP